MDTIDDAGDDDYVVTADMLIHEDVDDERTLDEEELDDINAGEDSDQYDNELEELQKEQDLPLEELLASYYGAPKVDSTTNDEEDAIKDKGDVSPVSSRPQFGTKRSSPSPKHVPPDLLLPPGLMDDIKEDNADKDQPCCSSSLSTSNGSTSSTVDKPSSTDRTSTSSNRNKRRLPYYRAGANPEALARLRPVPERLSMKLQGDNGIINSTFNRWLHSGKNDSSSDEDYSDWRKEIKVGRDFQATVPLSTNSAPYSKSNDDMLLWNPDKLPESKVKNYLIKINTSLQEKEGLPCGSNERDNEHALFTLQSCNYDPRKAEGMFSQEIPTGCGVVPWSDEECKKFEAGIRVTGKDFHALQKQVPTRTVKQIVEFYYLWKKSERYDQFLQQYGRMGRKKLAIAPGYLSDFMEEYMEPNRSSYPDIHYGTTSMSAEITKKSSVHTQQVDDRLSHTHHNKSIASRTS